MFIRLIKEIYRLISTRTSNFYLKITVKKKWRRYSKLQFSKFKRFLPLDQVLGSFISRRYYGNSFWNLSEIWVHNQSFGPITNNFSTLTRFYVKKTHPLFLTKNIKLYAKVKIVLDWRLRPVQILTFSWELMPECWKKAGSKQLILVKWFSIVLFSSSKPLLTVVMVKLS